MHLFRMYWRRTLKRPGSIGLWLLLPFAFMTIYTLVFGRDSDRPPKVGLALVDEDSSLVSRAVKGALGQGPIAELVSVRDASGLSEVEGLFADEAASAAILLPDGFSDRLFRLEPDTLVLYRNPRHFIGPQIAEGVVGGLVTVGNGFLGLFAEPIRSIRVAVDSESTVTAERVAEISRTFYEIGRDAPNLGALGSIDVAVVEEEGDDDPAGMNMAALFFPGLIMFGLLSVALSIEYRFLQDRLRRVTHRMVTSPVPPWQVAVQQRLYTASFTYVVGVVSAVLGGIIWRIPPQGLFTANLIAVALALFVAGFNGVIFSLSNSARAVSAIGSLVMVFLSILGGGFFPAELTPPTFQALAKLLPTGMANLGLTRALTGREPTISIPLLFAYCGVFFVAGVVAGRRRLV